MNISGGTFIICHNKEELTVSVSSVIVQENFAIGCFSYKGLLILSRADKQVYTED